MQGVRRIDLMPSESRMDRLSQEGADEVLPLEVTVNLEDIWWEIPFIKKLIGG